MDIIIYTTPEKLEHKQGGDGYETYYWYLRNAPSRFEVGDRIYFAVKGQVVGSFLSIEFNPHEEETIVWDADTWEEIQPIGTAPFQGFKYKWWED